MNISEIFGFNPKISGTMPLFTMSVSAGTPVPVEGEVERDIDLNQFLVEHPAATFFAKVKGKAPKGCDIYENDILIVDTSVEPKDGSVVIVSYRGNLSVKIYREIDGEFCIESSDGSFMPVNIEPYLDLKPIGVVTKVIHSF